MDGGFTKGRSPRSTLSRAVQAELVDTAVDKRPELPHSHREQPPVTRGLTRGATPVLTVKTQLDTITETYPSPSSMARLTRTDARQPTDENVEEMDKTILQQLASRPPRQISYTSFPEEFVDRVHSYSHPESLHTFVSEWLESVGSYGRRRCRLDSHLHRADDPVSRQPTKSAPETDVTWDVDGCVASPTPTSSGPRSYRTDTGSVTSRASGENPVEHPFYRSRNLASNNIYIRHVDEGLPNDIASLVQDIGKARDSPGPPLAQVWHDADLHQLEMGAEESDVDEYFRTNIYPYPKLTDDLKRSDRQPISRHAVPSTGSKIRVDIPIPDMLYGYTNRAFPQRQAQFVAMGNSISANKQGLLYPFLAIHFKADGPCGTGGGLWAATNQCLGSSASCVNLAERLNRQLWDYRSDEIPPINSAAFSVAMNGTEARLFVSWKQYDLDYYMQRVRSFLLQEPEQYLAFHKYVLNIIDWGKGRRLDKIRHSLDSLLEESWERASEMRKSLSPLSGQIYNQ